jgi:hypothetical protein
VYRAFPIEQKSLPRQSSAKNGKETVLGDGNQQISEKSLTADIAKEILEYNIVNVLVRSRNFA